MPDPTYPGLYISENSSGMSPITGVATSVTAFIGRALRGPVDEPCPINSFREFVRIFGGLWQQSTLGFAVRDYYRNGGSQAVIVRLFHPSYSGAEPDTARAAARAVAAAVKSEAAKDIAGHLTAADEAARVATPLSKARIQAASLELEAAYEGMWGNTLSVVIGADVEVTDEQKAAGLTSADFFNLTVCDKGTGVSEVFRNVTAAKEWTQRLDKILKDQSKLLRVRGDLVFGPAPPTGSYSVSERASDGTELDIDDFSGRGEGKGLYALDKADIFNLLCVPPYKGDGNIDADLIADVISYCERRRALFLLDPPAHWTDKTKAADGIIKTDEIGNPSSNAALYFPRLKQPNPLLKGRVRTFVPCGAVAGVFARTDARRGVWRAPAGVDATLIGFTGLSVSLTAQDNGELNYLGINCLTNKPSGELVVWGARTRDGGLEWRYIPIRRTALYIEESLCRGLQWAIFEPNDERLWAQISRSVGAFMHDLFRQGAFRGNTPSEAYFVKCGWETTTQYDVDRGIFNILVGFAPLKPAEFVVITLQQVAGQTQ